MEIKTKYKVEDLCWFYNNGKAKEAKVYRIDIEVYSNKTIVKYWFNVGLNAETSFIIVNDNLVFKTKEELINSL